MSILKTKDGVSLYYKDLGKGQPIVFSHGWPLSSDAWEDQMMFLAGRGFRTVAHDRRGHGRSDQPRDGNDMDSYADDLAQVMETLNLKDAILVGHSTGGGEVARYIGRHGVKRVAGVVLIGAVTPGILKTDKNPDGAPKSAFDDMRDGVMNDRAQFFKDFSAPFYGANRSGAKVSQGLRDQFWMQCMMGGLLAEYDCIAAFSESEFTDDLKKIDVPALIIHGDDDQIVSVENTAKRAAKLLKHAELKIYKGAPHGLPSTHKHAVNKDLLAFAQANAAAQKRTATR